MIQKVATILQVEDLAAAVAVWAAALGTAPTFVDGDRWAQFDVAGARLALAGTDRVGAPGLMAKVEDLDAEHARLAQAGLAPGEITGGGHERRFSVAMPDGALAVFYQPA